MELITKYLLLFSFVLFTYESNGFHTLPINKSSDTKAVETDNDYKCLVLQNADTINLIHGEKIQVTVIPGPSNDPKFRYLNNMILQYYEKKKGTFISFSLLFASKTFNRSSLSSILRI